MLACVDLFGLVELLPSTTLFIIDFVLNNERMRRIVTFHQNILFVVDGNEAFSRYIKGEESKPIFQSEIIFVRGQSMEKLKITNLPFYIYDIQYMHDLCHYTWFLTIEVRSIHFAIGKIENFNDIIGTHDFTYIVLKIVLITFTI